MVGDKDLWKPFGGDFELALIIARNSFDRWVARLSAAADEPRLSSLDILILRVVARQRARRATDIAFALGIEDIHLVQYSIKKLTRMEMISSEKIASDQYSNLTAGGQALMKKVDKVREACLLKLIDGDTERELEVLSALLQKMTALYEQAGRLSLTTDAI
jgi:predicted MarR family transcription regulator